jgi:hypothetical protein
MASSRASYPRYRPLLVSAACALILGPVLPGNAFGTFITSAGDAALSGALIQDFNSEPTYTFFASRTFLPGVDGFTVTAVSGDLHLDDQYCASFGTNSNCLDTDEQQLSSQ